jgi:trimethylamine:corrinoid methyltransferase-like protein
LNHSLFTDSQYEQMAKEVQQVLAEIGFHVGHPRVHEAALREGCRESAVGRLLFDPTQIETVRQRLLAQYPPQSPSSLSSPMHPRGPLRAGFGNLTPKVYDYPSRQAVGGSARHLTDLTKFAQMEPRLTGIVLPVSRQDIAPQIEQLDSVVLMARLTDKTLGPVDTTLPESVPYLAAMAEVLGCDPAQFIGSCNCINPPLRLEDRTAETLIQRSRYHSLLMITSMPALGGSAPVDLHAAIVLGAAEIVGGLIIGTIMDPEAPLLGYIASTQLDMRTGNSTSSTPQTVQLDAGVYQLMERHFGGGTRVGGTGYISATHPGFQALAERFLKAQGYAGLVNHQALAYAGTGNLGNGGILSPEQYLLDLEMIEGLQALWATPNFSPPGDVLERLSEGALQANADFLTQEHTLEHYRDEMWDPRYFQRLTDTRTEEQLVARAHEDYRSLVNSYQPAAYSADVLKELTAILEKARTDLLS